MGHSRIAIWYTAIVAVALLLSANPAMAQDDPPARVARLNFLYGSVSLQPAGENDWVAAVANRPLTSGDSLWVDAGGRAELHVGSTAIRLGQNTGVTLLEVSDRIVQFRIAQGSMIINARHLDDDDVLEADTPNLAFSILAPGTYRVDVNADGTDTAATVWRGQGQVTGGGRTYTVVAGQQAHFSGVDSLAYEISQIPDSDGFTNWTFDRDRHEDRADTANYVSREMTGYEDLDDHGQWSYVSAYGPVWRPVGVPAGWAPYRYGHWVWIEPWGWTWVDDQPWGFAPFHYGRWVFVGNGWVWVPGPVVIRPVYAPALVVFFGGGPRVAWFPLGPGEVFVPAYRVSPVYVTNVNVTNTRVNVTQVTNVYNSYTVGGTREVEHIRYANQQAPGGVTAVSRETFVSARPVGRNVVEMNAAEIARAPVTHVVPVAPVRGSVMGAGAPAASAPPPAVQHRMVVGSRLPAAPPPPFTQREPALNAHPGQPVTRSEVAPQQRSQAPPVARPAPHTEPAPPPRNLQPAPAQPAPHNPPAPPPRTLETQGTPPASRAPEPTAPQTAPRNPPTPPPRTLEMQGTPPAPRSAPPPPSHPAVQLAPPVQPKSPQESREEDQKFQRWQQQQQQPQQQQQKPAPPKTNKPPEKDKPNSGKPQQ